MFLTAPQLFTSWEDELASMNAGKRGGQYEYPNSLIDFAANVKDYTGMASRLVEGFLLGLSAYVPNVKRCDHTTLCRRINEYSKALKTRGGSSIAVDSSGLTPARRGGWLAFKHRKKQAYVKVHLAVDVRDGRILEFKVTPDSVHDNKVFPELVKKVRKRAPGLKKVLADGAYDDAKNDVLACEQKIKLVVPPRKNSRVRRKPPPESVARNNRVRTWKQLGKKRWKKKFGYGKRWVVEGVYSNWKRFFGECLSARTPKGVQAEVNRKVFLLNAFLAL
jgi:hypothetical protein